MKMQHALAMIEDAESPEGFAVSFEVREGGVLRSDSFPDTQNGETPIPDEAEAWDLATRFNRAANTVTVNIYVINAKDRTPVPGYDSKMLNKYP